VLRLIGFILTLIVLSFQLNAQDHSSHRMHMDETGMVMNENLEDLPGDCVEISRDYEFEVSAGTRFASDIPGTVFGYDTNEFQVEPCSRIRITLNNLDEVRHQWMLHGLPRYLYPGGMFHLEANGGTKISGSFIVPGDDQTYLVHCDITQHMEKGMKGQLKVGRGNGDLWAVPGISSGFRTDSRLPLWLNHWMLILLLGIPGLAFLIRRE
jgi:FtsP/CotA-like multicopper oxidase with cupredoxin domain